MPWLCTEFLINTPSMKENIFFPIDIYNDAAAQALYGLKQQFLYDEIEAELNLSFEQLLYALAEDIFKYFKTLASGILISKNYDAKFFAATGALGKANRASVFIESRYQSLMAQRNIQLLGRNVDLNALLSQSINEYLRKNTDYIIRRFESADLCKGLIELKYLTENIKVMHLLLSDYLTLDPFAAMYSEINDDINLGQKRSRVVSHIFQEVIQDLLPSFVFNSASGRFVRSLPEMVAQPDRARYPSSAQSWFWYGRRHERVFDKLTQMYHGFFGTEHLEAMLSVLSAAEIPLIINELTTEIENKILYDFHPYYRALIEAVPPMKLPKLAYGVVGGHGFFEVKLKNSIGSYEPLRPAVFQMLREIGNAILLVRQIELVQKTDKAFAFQQHAYFAGVRAHPVRAANAPAQLQPLATPFVFPAAGSVPPVLAAMRESFGAYNSSQPGVRPLNQSVVNDTLKIVEDALNQYGYDETNGSLLTGMLTRLRHQIMGAVGADWTGPANSLANPLEVEQPKTLARLLSCLQFLYCSPVGDGSRPSDLSVFGESWNWGVCTLIHLASQRRKFELIDLGLHVQRLDTLSPIDRERLETALAQRKHKPTDTDKTELMILDFLKIVGRIRARNDSIFESLASHLPPQPPVRFQVNPMDEAAVSALAVPAAGAIQAGAGAAAQRHSLFGGQGQSLVPPPPSASSSSSAPPSPSQAPAPPAPAPPSPAQAPPPPAPAAVAAPPPPAPAAPAGPPPPQPPPPSAGPPPPAPPPAGPPPPSAGAGGPPPPPRRDSLGGGAPPPPPPGRDSIGGGAPPPPPSANRPSFGASPPPGPSPPGPPGPPPPAGPVSVSF